VRLLGRQFRSIPNVSLLLLGSLAGSVPLSPVLQAQEADPSPYSDVWLVPEATSIQPGTPLSVAIYFEMEEGWHNYWQNAGDSGLPTEVEWDLPEGFTAGEIQWPVPERIVAYPLVDYGYSGRIALLVEITPPASLAEGSSALLAATVDWLICKEICLPAYQDVEVEIPVSSATPAPDPEWVGLFATTRDALPGPVEGWEADAEVTEDGYRLHISGSQGSEGVPEAVYFYASETNVLAHSEPQRLNLTDDGLTLELSASPYAIQPSPVLKGVLVTEGSGGWDEGGEATALWVEAEVAGAPQAVDVMSGSMPQGTEEGGVGLIWALAFAFLGGMLLNLMPCVFPVLSLKILGAAGQGGGNRVLIRNQGFAFGLGVVASFLLLAGLLVALRAGGAQLGWGFQLQSPLFVAAMAALFFAIGLNLMGVFEVGASLTRLGGRPGEEGGYGEAVASGVLATIIATPCTAPFMGAAMGFALTRSVAETLLVFGFLGLGMALPYVLLSVSPGLLERLPRPGAWMETLKQLLAFPMFATVIWLVWVFGQQTGVGGATYLLSALLLVAVAGWMVGRWTRTDRRSGVVARALALGTLSLAALLVGRGGGQIAPEMAITEGWQAFSQEAVERTLATRRPVFLDFTAAWCLTCQVNERLVLSSAVVMEAFEAADVALFKADWTRQDPAITAALEALGRNGVPVYALYSGGPGDPPTLLPAILTEEIVLGALAEHLPGE
jgi:thiol:disulfide interchange protein/DsbC/DsbD-like thiol-disulfide interchange protein